MTPEEKIAHGLTLTAEGIGELRIQRERLLDALDRNRAVLVGGEEHARALRWQAHRARRPRPLPAGRDALPAPPLFDGLRAQHPVPVDERTALGLRTAALSPVARTARPGGGWLARLLGGPELEPLCQHCLSAPCLCSPRALAPTTPEKGPTP